MTVNVLHPGAFWLLLATPVLWLVARKSLADFSRAQLVVESALRTLIVVLLAVALAQMEVRSKPSSAMSLVVAADVSASVSDDALAQIDETIRRLSRETRGPVVVVAFDNEPRLAELSLPLSSARRPAHMGTDISSALRFARAAAPAGHPARVVLITDGRATSGDALFEAQRTPGLAVIAAPAPTGPEVLLAGLDAPDSATAGATVDVAARIESTGPADAQVEFFLDGFRLGEPKSVTLRRGGNIVAAAARMPRSGSHEISATVSSDNDTSRLNNSASRVLAFPGETRVLIVEEREEDARFLVRALREAGLDVEVRAPAGFPADLAELDRFACLVLSDVPATDLTPAQMDLVKRWVEDLGGGFVMIGGESSFGLGGYFRTPVEAILPVRLDVEKKREEPTLAMMFVLDKSGSMEGRKIQLAKEACLATLDLLGPDDLVGVVSFDTDGYLVTPIDRASNRSRIVETVSSIEAGGGTNLYPALDLAAKELRRVVARVKHVVLLTDGKTQEGDYAGLVRRMAADGMTVSTVGVGEEAEVKLLQDVSRWGRGRYYFTRDASSIPQIFTREAATASRSAVVEEPFRPRVVRDVEVLGGIDFAKGPYLLGYVSTKPRPNAEVLLASDRSEPVLARTRAGLGRTVAFTSDAKNRWAAEWLSWGGYGKFWAQVIRDVCRPKPSGASEARIDFAGDVATLTVDAADAAGRMRNRLAAEAVVIPPDAGAQPFRTPLAQDAPGRYRATFKASARGTWTAAVRLGAEALSTAAVKSAASEFSGLGPDGASLDRLAGAAGGKVADGATWAVPTDFADVIAARPLAPACLVLALALFVIDLALRRIDFRTMRRPKPGEKS